MVQERDSRRGISLKSCWIYRCLPAPGITNPHTDANEHTCVGFCGGLGGEALHIVYLLRQLSGFSTPSFLHGLPSLRPPHPRSHCSSVSSLARFSLCRLPFRQKGVCQVPNPLAKRSKADKETGDLLFYSGKAKKWNPPSPGLCILPSFLPAPLFHSFNPTLVFFLFCQNLSPPRPRCL